MYALEEHEEKVRLGDRTITNLWFADGTGALAKEERQLGTQVKCLENPA